MVLDPLHDIEVSVLRPPPGNVVDDRDARGAAEPPGQYQHVARDCRIQGPATTVGTTQAETLSDLKGCDPACHASDRADRMTDQFGIFRVGDDRDRYLADPVEVNHVELSRLKAIIRGYLGRTQAQLQRKHIRPVVAACRDLRFLRDIFWNPIEIHWLSRQLHPLYRCRPGTS